MTERIYNRTRRHLHIYLDYGPLIYAELARWIYDRNLNHSPPSGRFLDATLEGGVRFALVELGQSKKFNVLVIRGTEPTNAFNLASDSFIGSNGGKVDPILENATRLAVKKLSRVGKIHVVTGHSLGGRLAEIVVQHGDILGFTFNSYLANKNSKIIGFRLPRDIARVHKGKEDRIIGSSKISAKTLDPISSHSIDNMIKHLKDENYWEGFEYARAREIAPSYSYEGNLRQNYRSGSHSENLKKAAKKFLNPKNWVL